MSCDLTSGRLRGECLVGRAGIKTLYFTKYNDFAALTGITESGGEITSLGADPLVIYQFDMGLNVGNFEEVATVSKDNGTAFITQTINLTLFNIKPADLNSLNNLKKGRWAIWTLDFQDKIRLFGRVRGCVATGGSDVSGVAPGDKKGLDLILVALDNNYAPFMQDYSTTPFDNYANVSVTVTGFSAELLTSIINGTSFPYTTFSWAAGVLACAKPAQPAFEGCASNDLGAAAVGDKFQVTGTLTLNSGSAPLIMLVDSDAGYAGIESNSEILTAGVNIFDLTRTTLNANNYLQIRPSDVQVTDFLFTNISIKKYL